jgi:DNA-binding XRE family transcriptional regulator
MYKDELLTIREIAAKVGRSYSVVRRDLAGRVTFRGSWSLHRAKDAQAEQELRTLAYATIQEVCRLLCEERKARMTQTEAARRLGVSGSTLSRLEMGRRESYPLPLLIAFCEVLDVKISGIFARAEQLMLSDYNQEEHHGN